MVSKLDKYWVPLNRGNTSDLDLLREVGFSNEDFVGEMHGRNYKSFCVNDDESDRRRGRDDESNLVVVEIHYDYRLESSLGSNLTSFLLAFETVVHDSLVKSLWSLDVCDDVEHVWDTPTVLRVVEWKELSICGRGSAQYGDKARHVEIESFAVLEALGRRIVG